MTQTTPEPTRPSAGSRAYRASVALAARIIGREACDDVLCFSEVWCECGCVKAAREIVEAIS